MSKATRELVQSVIRSQPDFDTLHAEDLNTGDRCGYAHGSPEVLAAYVDELEGMMIAPYRVRLTSSKVDKKRGNKPVEQRAFVWILPGRHGWPGSSVPAAPVNAAPSSPALPLADLKQAARDGVLVEVMEERLSVMAARIEQLERELEEAEEEAEELSEAAEQPPLSFWHTKEAADMLRPLSEALADGIRGLVKWKLPASSPSPTARGTALVNGAEGGKPVEHPEINPEEIRLVLAWRKFAEVDPETANGYAAQLVNTFSNEQPPNDGQREAAN